MTDTPTDKEIRAQAIAEYSSETIQIDSDADISRSEEPGPAGETGAWVAAWVYVRYPQPRPLDPATNWPLR